MIDDDECEANFCLFSVFVPVSVVIEQQKPLNLYYLHITFSYDRFEHTCSMDKVGLLVMMMVMVMMVL